MKTNRYEEAPTREPMRKAHYQDPFSEYDERCQRSKQFTKELLHLIQNYINQPVDHFWGAVKKKYNAYENGCYIYGIAERLLNRPNQLYRDSYWVDEEGFIRYKKKDLRRYSETKMWAEYLGISTKATASILKKKRAQARKIRVKNANIKLYEATEATLKERKLQRNNEKRISNFQKKQ